MNETAYTAKVRKKLDAEGALTLKWRPGNGQRAGVPDLWVGHPHWQGWIEFKMDRNKLRPVQKSVINMLTARGVPTLIIRGPKHQIEDATGAVCGTLDLDIPLVPQLRRFSLCS